MSLFVMNSKFCFALPSPDQAWKKYIVCSVLSVVHLCLPWFTTCGICFVDSKEVLHKRVTSLVSLGIVFLFNNAPSCLNAVLRVTISCQQSFHVANTPLEWAMTNSWEVISVCPLQSRGSCHEAFAECCGSISARVLMLADTYSLFKSMRYMLNGPATWEYRLHMVKGTKRVGLAI